LGNVGATPSSRLHRISPLPHYRSNVTTENPMASALEERPCLEFSPRTSRKVIIAPVGSAGTSSINSLPEISPAWSWRIAQFRSGRKGVPPFSNMRVRGDLTMTSARSALLSVSRWILRRPIRLDRFSVSTILNRETRVPEIAHIHVLRNDRGGHHEGHFLQQ